MGCCVECDYWTKEAAKMKHNCKDRMCDTPHDEPTTEERQSEMQYAQKQYLAWMEGQEKEHCRHGFIRALNTPYDCQQCVAMEIDKAIAADQDFQTHKI